METIVSQMFLQIKTTFPINHVAVCHRRALLTVSSLSLWKTIKIWNWFILFFVSLSPVMVWCHQKPLSHGCLFFSLMSVCRSTSGQKHSTTTGWVWHSWSSEAESCWLWWISWVFFFPLAPPWGWHLLCVTNVFLRLLNGSPWNLMQIFYVFHRINCPNFCCWS